MDLAYYIQALTIRKGFILNYVGTRKSVKFWFYFYPEARLNYRCIEQGESGPYAKDGLVVGQTTCTESKSEVIRIIARVATTGMEKAFFHGFMININ